MKNISNLAIQIILLFFTFQSSLSKDYYLVSQESNTPETSAFSLPLARIFNLMVSAKNVCVGFNFNMRFESSSIVLNENVPILFSQSLGLAIELANGEVGNTEGEFSFTIDGTSLTSKGLTYVTGTKPMLRLGVKLCFTEVSLKQDNSLSFTFNAYLGTVTNESRPEKDMITTLFKTQSLSGVFNFHIDVPFQNTMYVNTYVSDVYISDEVIPNFDKYEKYKGLAVQKYAIYFHLEPPGSKILYNRASTNETMAFNGELMHTFNDLPSFYDKNNAKRPIWYIHNNQLSRYITISAEFIQESETPVVTFLFNVKMFYLSELNPSGRFSYLTLFELIDNNNVKQIFQFTVQPDPAGKIPKLSFQIADTDGNTTTIPLYDDLNVDYKPEIDFQAVQVEFYQTMMGEMNIKASVIDLINQKTVSGYSFGHQFDFSMIQNIYIGGVTKEQMDPYLSPLLIYLFDFQVFSGAYFGAENDKTPDRMIGIINNKEYVVHCPDFPFITRPTFNLQLDQFYEAQVDLGIECDGKNANAVLTSCDVNCDICGSETECLICQHNYEWDDPTKKCVLQAEYMSQSLRRKLSEFGVENPVLESTDDLSAQSEFFQTHQSNMIYRFDITNGLEYPFAAHYDLENTYLSVSEGVKWTEFTFLPYKPEPTNTVFYEMTIYIDVMSVENPQGLTYNISAMSYPLGSYDVNTGSSLSLKGTLRAILGKNNFKIDMETYEYMIKSDSLVSLEEGKYNILKNIQGVNLTVQAKCKNNCKCDAGSLSNKNQCLDTVPSVKCSPGFESILQSFYPLKTLCAPLCPVSCLLCREGADCNCVDANDRKGLHYLGEDPFNLPECHNCSLPVCTSTEMNILSLRRITIPQEIEGFGPPPPVPIQITIPELEIKPADPSLLGEYDFVSEFQVYQPKFQCPSKCKKCRFENSEPQCLDCDPGHLWNEQNKECQKHFNSKYHHHCDILVEENGSCKLYNGFIINDQHNKTYISDCPANCETCHSSTECLFCAPGLVNVGKRCIKMFRIPSRGFEVVVSPVVSEIFSVMKVNSHELYFKKNDFLQFTRSASESQTENEFKQKKKIFMEQGIKNPEPRLLSSPNTELPDSDYELIHQQTVPSPTVYNAYIKKKPGSNLKCKTKTFGNFCSECADGYFFDPAKRDCVFVSQKTKKAVFSQSLSQVKVETCVESYFLSTKLNRCMLQVENCNEMDSDGTCIRCLSGFMLAPSRSKCLVCLENCRECLSSSNCVSCDPEFYPKRLNLHVSSKIILFRISLVLQ